MKGFDIPQYIEDLFLIYWISNKSNNLFKHLPQYSTFLYAISEMSGVKMLATLHHLIKLTFPLSLALLNHAVPLMSSPFCCR